VLRLAVGALLTLLLAWAAPAADASELSVLADNGQSLLWDFLIGQVEKQSAQRQADVARAIRSPEAMQARQRQLCADLRELVGELPERSPLNAKTLGTIACDGYRIEKVLYESRPGHHVTANLYLPADTSHKVPGVLVPCGHSANGKASEAYQSVCALLARSGCAALVYDPIGQGERNQLPDTVQHGTTEHTLVGAGALLVGWNTATYRIWDGLRSMDYLAARPEVDSKRLGCTGNSGGGTMTTWLMAVDDRIVAAAPSCFITTVERLFKTIGPQDCEQHFPNQGMRGIDHTDFITMRAPKPTLILAAERDYFDFAGTREAYAQARDVYRVLERPEQVGLFSYDDEHGFSRPRREAAVGWMRRWLADDARPVSEPPLVLQPDAQLQVTRSGQVVGELDGEVTVVELAQRQAKALADKRLEVWRRMDEPGRRATIRRLLGLRGEPAPQAVTFRDEGTVDRETYTVAKVVIEAEGQVPLPALVCTPKQTAAGEKRPAVIYCDDRGKAGGMEQGGAIEQLLAAGDVVIAVDLRGFGETADAGEGGKYHNAEFRTAMLAMHIGQPLVGQRVADLLEVLQVVSKLGAVDSNAIELVGVGRAAPVALHAAAIEPRFAKVTLRDGITSWADDVVARPTGEELLGLVVPGVLAHYDLPDLAAMLGDRLTVEPRR
jgi:cephalosporin-C deacetylase-like acetyl esterase